MEKINNVFKRQPKYLDKVGQQQDSKTFVLLYGKNDIGYLKYERGKWQFRYSIWFREQDVILPLIEFPKKAKVYESDELWSFFISRIPSTKQPKIKELIATGKNPNIADLLELFGKRTINNPFVLETR